MQGLTGLTAIAGYQVQIDDESQASPIERSGDVADPRHAIKDDTRKHPYPWEANSTQAAKMHGPYGPANQMLGDEWWFFEPAGSEWDDPTFDHTPSRRAAPYPKGILSGPIPGENPDAVGRQREQSAQIHASDTGASKQMQLGYEAQNDHWESITELNPGHSEQATLPKQAMASGFMWGTTDRVQSMARQNQHGYDSAHMLRRWAVAPIPGNTMWLKPGGRPLVKSLPGPARPAIGPDSPFEGQDLGRAFSVDGAILQNVPSEYVAPPSPGLAPAVVSVHNDSVVEWY